MNNNNTSIVEITFEIVKYVITFLIGIFFIPLKKLFYTEDEKFCVFIVKGSNEKIGRAIKVTKWFGKTTSINCGLFNERRMIEYNKIKFLFCSFGRNPPFTKNYHGGYCPFDKIPKFK